MGLEHARFHAVVGCAKGLHFPAFETLYDIPAYAFHAKEAPLVVERFIQTARKMQLWEE